MEWVVGFGLVFCGFCFGNAFRIWLDRVQKRAQARSMGDFTAPKAKPLLVSRLEDAVYWKQSAGENPDIVLSWDEWSEAMRGLREYEPRASQWTGLRGLEQYGQFFCWYGGRFWRAPRDRSSDMAVA